MTVTRTLGLGLALGYLLPGTAHALDVTLGYIQWKPDPGPVLSNILPEPEDAGLRGAELGVQDNNETGQFLDQHYLLESVVADSEDAALDALAAMLDDGLSLFVLNVPADTLRAMATELEGRGLAFNAGAREVELRLEACAPHLLHTQPSHAMLTDALSQWLNQRRWNDVFLITGPTESDLAWAEAFRRSAAKFHLNIVADRPWTFDADLRRTASAELPVFTQGEEYDAVVVADERGDFGEYVPFNTWLPRPVVGTQGLTPTAWHHAIENWGAAQLQGRFRELAARHMTGDDYAAWVAMRSVGEAVTRLGTGDAGEIRAYLLSDDFDLAAFKGRKLSYRDWNGQLRQPIPLVHPRALVTQAPIEGFLHPHSDMDTLGYDRPESRCRIGDR